MSKDTEDLIININTKVDRLVDIENLLEKIANSKPEVYEMNSRDREVLQTGIRDFEHELSETLRRVFNANLEESRRERLLIIESNQKIYDDNLDALQNKLKDFQKVADSCKDLDVLCFNAINQAVDLNSIQQKLNHTMVTTVKEILSKLTIANEKTTKNFNGVTEEMQKLLKKSLHIAFVIPVIVLVFLAYIGGIGTLAIWNKKTCENVFEKFYADKYEKEISQPMIEAKKEAAEYLRIQKSEADEIRAKSKKEAEADLKAKKAEAKEYLKEQLDSARTRAQEEYERRMELYDQRVHNDVDLKMKKSNIKGDK